MIFLFPHEGNFAAPRDCKKYLPQIADGSLRFCRRQKGALPPPLLCFAVGNLKQRHCFFKTSV